MMVTRTSSKPSRTISLVAAALAAAGIACGPAAPRVHVQEALVRVETDAALPLGDVALTYRGRVLTHTSPMGLARLRMTGKDGDTFRLGVVCPEGYEVAGTRELDVVVRSEGGDRVPEFGVRCARATRRALVAVLANNGADLPVLHLGREVGRTDASGAATLALDVRPGSVVELVLDTQGNPRIHPASPTLSFVAPERDDFVVLDHAFRVERPRTVRAVARGPVLPRALSARSSF
jgi:hypothetical protein